MELLQLQYFVRVAEQGSFTDAAVLLGVTQPTLSRKVRALEVELRANLFHRNGRGAQLTEAGHRFLDQTRGLLRTLDAATLSVRDDAAAMEGHVAIGLPPSLGKLLIPPLIRQFAQRFPRASISIAEELSSPLYERLATGRLDLAVLRNPAASAHLAIEPIAQEHFYLVGARPVGRRGRAVSLQELLGLPFIMPSAPHTFRPLLEAAMARIGGAFHVAFEVDSIGASMDVVADGLAYAISPESTMRTAAHGDGLSWQRIAAPELTSRLCLVMPSRQTHSRLLAESAGMVRTIIAQRLKKTAGGRRAAAR